MTNAPKSWTVSHFMTLQPCTVDHGLSLDDAGDRMTANNIRHLLVTRSGRLVGVLSNRDISVARAILSKKKGDNAKIDEAMSEDVYTCGVDTALEEVATQMEEHRYGCAVILDDDFVVGIFTTTDAMRALRSVIRGEAVEPRTIPTHLVDVTAEREKVEHHVRLSDRLGSYRNDGTIGTVGLR
jgi:CBS domain-containing protein